MYILIKWNNCENNWIVKAEFKTHLRIIWTIPSKTINKSSKKIIKIKKKNQLVANSSVTSSLKNECTVERSATRQDSTKNSKQISTMRIRRFSNSMPHNFWSSLSALIICKNSLKFANQNTKISWFEEFICNFRHLIKKFKIYVNRVRKKFRKFVYKILSKSRTFLRSYNWQKKRRKTMSTNHIKYKSGRQTKWKLWQWLRKNLVTQ